MNLDKRTTKGKIINKTIRNTKIVIYLLLIIYVLVFTYRLIDNERLKAEYKNIKYLNTVIKIYDPIEIELRKLRKQNQELQNYIKGSEDLIQGLENNNKNSVITYIHIKFKEAGKLAQAIFTAESGLNCRQKQDYLNKDKSIDYGVAQINSVHLKRVNNNAEKLLDCKTNIDVAYQIYTEQGFTPWVAYTNGSYKKHL